MQATVFGPWFGEFGWELARWNPACRYLASKTPGKKYAIGPRGHGVIYEFVDEYIDFDESFNYIPRMHTFLSADHAKLREYYSIASKLGKVVDPTLVRYKAKFNIKPHKYVGTKGALIDQITQKRPLICVFPRQRKHDPHRNWPISNWINVIQYYCSKKFHVIAFGGPEDKMIPTSHPFFTDYIGYKQCDELDVAVSALNKSVVSIAIQSGGIYLGMYAGNRSVAFGIKMHTNRLKSEDHLRSNYKYVIVPDFKFSPQFLISSVGL